MFEVIFLIVLGLVWIIFASVQDLKQREVANWLNFSLIVFALGFRFFWSLFEKGNLNFFYQGLIGLGIFFVLGNTLYYSRMFAGGDAKLMIALGTVLAFSESFYVNLKIFIWFLLIFLFVGAFYGFVWSFALMAGNFKSFKKEFSKRLNQKRKLVYFVMFVGILIMVLSLIEILFFYFGVLIFILPYFYLYAKSVDESCMIKKIKPTNLTEGDWLYKDVKIGKKLIKAKWDGLDKKEIGLLRKKREEVLIRQGIAFVPVFLISFLVLVYVGLRYSFW